jgi:hypothetical protein
LGPIGTAATNRPIVPAWVIMTMEKLVERLAGDTEVLRENVPLCPSQTPHAAPMRTMYLNIKRTQK